MARQITVLDQSGTGSGTRSVTIVFWFPITNNAAKVPLAGFRSMATNVTTAEQADLEAGNVLEEVYPLAFPASYTTAQMKAEILARYTDRATAVAALPAVRAYYGVTYDSAAGWSA